MTTMTDPATRVTAGVDTHHDMHLVAALDERGGRLGVEAFSRRRRLPQVAALAAHQVRVARPRPPRPGARSGARQPRRDLGGALLVSAGDKPERLHSEAAFAHLCGSSPIDASSGLVVRKRLSRGGDRRANEALCRIVMVRMVSDPRTRHSVERRTTEGRSKRESMRCLKRYVARELYPLLAGPPTAP